MAGGSFNTSQTYAKACYAWLESKTKQKYKKYAMAWRMEEPDKYRQIMRKIHYAWLDPKP